MIKSITINTEYRQALKRADNLIDVDSEPGTPQADELGQLVELIERWEDEHYLPEPMDSDGAVKFLKEQQGSSDLCKIGTLFQASRESPLLPDFVI